MTFAADNPLKKLKYFIIFFLVLLSVSNYVAGWTATGVYSHKAHPGKCYYNERLILSPGQRAKISNTCSVIACRDKNGSADIYGCGAVAPPTNCEWGDYININAPYSECCAKKAVCKNSADRKAALIYQNDILEMFKKQN
ncbi:uncharacterized protein LOC119670094 [Teleopsis dalmanni]|uniref:uncharacterized protein LOC119670094 n=1 Tax=Teleopsis dalmanni TaxID=139649 RepID=UPI0018CF2867|nr:uncharacterized protein LOC119670094 [Teleopsis dalmanni]